MVTLAEAVNAKTRLIPVSGDVSGAVFGRQYRIDDEIVTLRAFERDWDAIGKPVNDHRWLVTRGAEHSVAASHNSGVDVVGSVDASVSSETLAPPAPFASEGGGGAVSVTDGTTTVADVTSLSVTGATVAEAAPGEAEVTVTGGIQQVRLLGPFEVNFDDAGVDDDGVLVATLDVGDIILSAWVVTTTEWLANGDGQGHSCSVSRGPGTGLGAVEYTGFGALTSGPSFGTESAGVHLIQHVTADARSLTVAVFPSAATFTTGSLDCYALMATPA